MVCKNSQRNADDKKTGGITEHFPQHEAVYKLGIGHAGADESRQKKNNHLYHAPKSGSGDHHAVSHRQVVEQSDALLVDPFGHLPANRLTFLLKHTSRFCANGNFTCSAQGRDRLVQSGQNFRKPAFEFLHPVTQNADGPIIVFQRIGQAVFLLHPFGCRERRVYF